MPMDTSLLLRPKILKKDSRAHYKYVFNKILESYHFWLTKVMFNSGEHTILTFYITQFIILIYLSPEQKYPKT